MVLRPYCRFWVFPGWAPRPIALNIGVRKTVLVFEDNGAEPGLGTLERKQRNSCFDKVLGLSFGQLVGYPL